MGQFDLCGKVALVTGGGNGLGAGIAEALVEAGAAVVVADIDMEGAEQVATQLEQRHARTLPFRMDVTKEEEVRRAIEAGCREFGRLDVLVNNAGVVMIENALDLPMADWDRVFEVNVRALFQCARIFAKRLIQQGHGGSVINIASNAGKNGYVGQCHYNASKAAVISITQTLAKELAEYGINVNAVCPGAVDTDMLRRCMHWTIEQSGGTVSVDDLCKSWAPPQLGRLITPIEVGRVIAFLASEAAAIIRGQSINVDAGVTP